MLINAGVDVVAVSKALGHKDILTTLGIYSHMFQEAKARTSDAIANAFSFIEQKDTGIDNKKETSSIPEINT